MRIIISTYYTGHLQQQPAAASSRQQPPAAASSRQQPPAAASSRQRQPAASTCQQPPCSSRQQQPEAASSRQQQPAAASCSQPPAPASSRDAAAASSPQPIGNRFPTDWEPIPDRVGTDSEKIENRFPHTPKAREPIPASKDRFPQLKTDSRKAENRSLPLEPIPQNPETETQNLITDTSFSHTYTHTYGHQMYDLELIFDACCATGFWYVDVYMYVFV